MKIEGKELTYTATLVVAPSDSLHRHHADYVMDGTDDHLDINQAIADLPAGGGEVVILDGTANINGEVTLNKDHVTLWGMGTSTKLRLVNGHDADLDFLHITGNNVTVRDMELDGNWANQGAGNQNGVVPDGCDYFSLISVYCHSFNYYLVKNNSYVQGDYWLVDRCMFDDCPNMFLISMANDTNIQISNCFFDTTGMVAWGSAVFVDWPTIGFKIKDNVILANGQSYGMLLYAYEGEISGNTIIGDGVNTLDGIYDASGENNGNSITGNYIEGCVYGGWASGIISETYGSTIGDNIIVGCVDGIYTRRAGNIVVGNHVRECTRNGIRTTGDTSTIVGNTVSGHLGDYAINVAGYGNVCNGNTVLEHAKHGIFIDYSGVTCIGNVVIRGGTAAANTYDGILVNAHCDDCIIVGNTVEDDWAGSLRYNINISAATCDRNVVAYNNVQHGTAGWRINDAGTGTIIRDNVGYITEAWGTATIANGTNSITVAHGLSTTPTVVFPTGQHEETRDCIVTNIGAANFDIETGDGVNVTGDRTVMWYAYGGKP